MKNYKSNIITALLLLWVAMVVAQNEFTIPLSDPNKRGKLNASINSGTIIVKGTARKDILVKYSTDDESDKPSKKDNMVHVNVNINKNGNNDDEQHSKSKDGLRRISGSTVDLSASEDDNNVRIQSNSWNEEINLIIEIPSGMDVKLHTYNDGDLKISNVSGALDLNNFNGGILAENIKGSVIASTYNDDIKVTFDEVKDGVPMSFTTFNGDIDITYPATTKATMKFKTDQGDIYTGFDMDVKSDGPLRKEDSKGGVYKVSVNEWKKGSINGGGAEVTYKTYNGDIYVRKK